MRILLVDDDDVDREKLRRLVQRCGKVTEIREANSGSCAEAYLKAETFDCVFMDYNLGDILGTELIPAVHGHRRQPCPVIMVTGADDELVAVEAMRGGVYDYLRKARLDQHHVSNALDGSQRWASLEQDLKETQQRLERLSMFDQLTGLPNRNLFFDRLDRHVLSANRTSKTFALLMIDLNKFKEVNDTLGHLVGDELLYKVGQRIQSTIRGSDTAARLGGDEFSSILPGISSAGEAMIVASKIAAVVREPVRIDGRTMSIGLSIGVALFPQHGTDAKSLLAHADLAMYAAKKGTRDIVAYTDALGEAQSKSTRIAGQLPDALENNELFLEFQPKINLRSMNLIGVEAFVRWRHPELGVLLPMDFIPAAEQSSIIGPLSSIVVDMALTHAAAWQKDFPTLSVSVNLSAQLVDDPGLAASVFQALNLRAMPPSALVIELTETALMTSPVRAARALKELSAGGVAISIDDFGTGFFSFKNLRDLEIAEIKIDTTFVAKLLEGGRDATIVRSLVELARGFDIRLVAEGIEDELTCDMLRRMKCDCGQGYWIGRPMDSQKLPDWAAHWEHRNNRTVGAPRV